MTLYLSQINIRFLLLGLVTRIPNNTKTNLFKHKFGRLVKLLQLQLAIQGNLSLSEVIIEELVEFRPSFDALDFWEQIFGMMNKLHVIRVADWVDGVIVQRRKQLVIKVQAVPYTTQQKIASQNSSGKMVLQKSSGNAKPNEGRSTAGCSKTIGKQQHTKRLSDETCKQIKQQTRNSLSNIKLANKMRKSAIVFPNRYNNKYKFKSNNTRDIFEQQQDSMTKLDMYCKNSTSQIYFSPKRQPDIKAQPKSEQDTGKYFCEATPPHPAPKPKYL